MFAGAALGADKKSVAIEVTLQPSETTLTDEQLAKWEVIKKDNLPEINRLFRSLGVDLLKTKY